MIAALGTFKTTPEHHYDFIRIVERVNANTKDKKGFIDVKHFVDYKNSMFCSV